MRAHVAMGGRPMEEEGVWQAVEEGMSECLSKFIRGMVNLQGRMGELGWVRRGVG